MECGKKIKKAMTLPTNIQELKKICVQPGCASKRQPGKQLCNKHQKIYERKANATPKAPDPRYKEL